MEPLIAVDKLCVTYRTPGRPPVEAVRGVSFAVPAGEAFGIVGESGCGKTSLVKTIMGLQKPSAGRVLFAGLDTARFDRAASRLYRRQVQMIFQDAVGSLNPRMTIRQTLEEVLTVHGLVSGDALPKRIAALLDRVGLGPQVLPAYPRELSGGQCQRISFARALALEPKLIIADEPVSALDVSVQARILNLIRDLQRDLGLTVILISHDLAVVRNVCSDLAVMHAGQFVETGRSAEVFANPRHPYTRQLLAAVPDIDRALARAH